MARSVGPPSHSCRPPTRRRQTQPSRPMKQGLNSPSGNRSRTKTTLSFSRPISTATPKGSLRILRQIKLDQQKTAALQSATVEQPNDKIELSDPQSLHEIRERLYELNFDPGPFDGPMSASARQAVREFEQANKLASTGEATQGLLRRLREISGLKPWGSIVYSKTTNKWGMAWSLDTRKAAVASARAPCGDASQCPIEISFFGTECGVFAHSESSWAMVARADMQKAKEDALSDCRKKGKTCRILLRFAPTARNGCRQRTRAVST